MMSTSSTASDTWITSFCSLLGHEYFAEVTEDFIEDDFNLTGLQSQVPKYKEALEMILDVEPDEYDDYITDEDDDDDDEMGDKFDRRIHRRELDEREVESSAELLYGLIHQRFITSRQGIQQMAEKYEAQHFGFCPRVFCNQARVLPVGCSDIPGHETVKLFCPSCLDVYTPPNSRFQSVDGAFFGTTFGCLFFMTYPDFQVAPKDDPLGLRATHPTYNDVDTIGQSPNAATSKTNRSIAKASRSSSLNTTPTTSSAPTGSINALNSTATQSDIVPLPPQPTVLNGTATQNIAPGLGAGRIHEPRIYGFRVAERARTGPRMKWLRMRPRDMNELDEARLYEEVYGPSDDAEDEVITSEPTTDGNVHRNDSERMDTSEAAPISQGVEVNGTNFPPGSDRTTLETPTAEFGAVGDGRNSALAAIEGAAQRKKRPLRTRRKGGAADANTSAVGGSSMGEEVEMNGQDGGEMR